MFEAVRRFFRRGGEITPVARAAAEPQPPSTPEPETALWVPTAGDVAREPDTAEPEVLEDADEFTGEPYEYRTGPTDGFVAPTVQDFTGGSSEGPEEEDSET